jgi:hypothetical protein
VTAVTDEVPAGRYTFRDSSAQGAKEMTRNEGTLDRIVRAILGAALLLLALTSVSSPVIYWGGLVVGLVLVVTALSGFCPAYRLLGIRTCRR